MPLEVDALGEERREEEWTANDRRPLLHFWFRRGNSHLYVKYRQPVQQPGMPNVLRSWSIGRVYISMYTESQSTDK